MDTDTDNQNLHFGWLDYTSLITMLGVSTLIGIYFGCCGKKINSPTEYLFGGKDMPMVPIAISLITSYLSGVLMLGSTTEVYVFGTLYWLDSIAYVFVGLLAYYIYMPVFYELQLISIYQYLELRFNRTVKMVFSAIFTIKILLYVSIVLYIPALAFNQVSGVNLKVTVPIIAIICIFYTMMGGLKAVVWTDVFQGLIILISSLVILIVGVVRIGGFAEVWDRNAAGGRIRFFEMDPSPLKRMTVWSITFCQTFLLVSLMVFNQGMIQKFMALPKFSQVKTSIILLCLGNIIILTISCYTGALMFAEYHDCDPIKAKLISKPDQLLPYYITDIGKSLPGLPGLFIAGIFSGALSTASSNLNSLAANIFEDFVRPCLRKQISERCVSTIMKGLVLISGVISIIIIFILDEATNVLQMTMTFNGITGGTLAGLFSFGMFFPRGNSKGAVAGAICSLAFVSWIAIGNRVAKSDKLLREPTLPTSVEGCSFNVSLPETTAFKSSVIKEDVFVLYRISFLYYSVIGIIIIFIVGIIVSLLTEHPDEENIKPAFFIPPVKNYIIRRNKKNESKEPAELMLLEKKDISV